MATGTQTMQAQMSTDPQSAWAVAFDPTPPFYRRCNRHLDEKLRSFRPLKKTVLIRGLAF